MDLQNIKLIDVSDIQKKHKIGAKRFLKEIIILVNFVTKEVAIWKQTILSHLLIFLNYGLNYQMAELYAENVMIKQKYQPVK